MAQTEAQESDIGPASTRDRFPERWVPAAVSIAALAVFWWNAAPSATFKDSGEFAMAAASGGIPHPPGAPSWVIGAWAFVHLGGFEDPAYGTNLYCGLLGAATLGLLSWIALAWCRRLFPNAGRPALVCSALAGPLILMSSRAFVELSVTTEQYTLMTALLAGLLALATRLGSSEVSRPAGAAFFIGLLWGLAIGNHPSQAVLVFLVVWAWILSARRSQSLRPWGFGLLGLALGLFVFAWLPIRSGADPILDWGNPESAAGFFDVLMRRHWGARPLSEAPSGLLGAWLGSYEFVRQIGVLGIASALAGAFALARTDSRLFWWLALGAIPYSAGMFVGHLAQPSVTPEQIRLYGTTDWHLPVYLCAAIASAVGICWALSASARLGRAVQAAASLVVLVAGGATSALSVRAESLRGVRSPADFADRVVAPLDSNGVLLVGSDNLMFLLGYRRYVLRRYPELWLGWSTMPLTTAMRIEKTWDRESLLRNVRRLAQHRELNPLNSPPLDEERLRSAPIYTDFPPDGAASASHLEPAGLLFQVRAEPVGDDQVRRSFARTSPRRGSLPKPESLDVHARGAWADLLLGQGTYFVARRLWPEAEEALEEMLSYFDSSGSGWFLLGSAKHAQGKAREAADAYVRAIELSPNSPGPRGQFASLLLSAGRREDAERLAREELALDPGSELASRVLERLGGRNR